MKAELIYEHKRYYPNGDVSEITIRVKTNLTVINIPLPILEKVKG